MNWKFWKEVEQQVEPRKLDISEPIYSFVECVKANPSRFVASYQNSEEPEGYYRVVIVDKVLDKTHSMLYHNACYYGMYFTSEQPSFLTQDEMRYIYDEVRALYMARKARYDDLKAIRQRREYMKLYCEEGEKK